MEQFFLVYPYLVFSHLIYHRTISASKFKTWQNQQLLFLSIVNKIQGPFITNIPNKKKKD